MTDDPIGRIAHMRLLETSIDLRVQLEKGTGTRPVLYMLAKARERASNAMIQLVIADASDAATIRKLQAEIALYDDMVMSCRDLIAAGRDADRAISEEDREEIQQVIMTDEQRAMYGIQPMGAD